MRTTNGTSNSSCISLEWKQSLLGCPRIRRRNDWNASKMLARADSEIWIFQRANLPLTKDVIPMPSSSLFHRRGFRRSFRPRRASWLITTIDIPLISPHRVTEQRGNEVTRLKGASYWPPLLLVLFNRVTWLATGCEKEGSLLRDESSPSRRCKHQRNRRREFIAALVINVTPIKIHRLNDTYNLSIVLTIQSIVVW